MPAHIARRMDSESRITRGNTPDFSEITWLSSHKTEVDMHKGKWIALRLPDGIIASHKSLEKVIEKWKKDYPSETPFVFMVPSHKEGAIML